MPTMKLAPLVLALCSCVLPEPGVSKVEQSVKPNCEEWGCGMNSPIIASHGISFFYGNGGTTPQGFAIDHFEQNGTDYTFHVNDGRITGARRTNMGIVTIADAGLIGAKLHLS